ncbi:MAG: pantoate--beta-alanine ligase, partial [Duncaniella sp.]|nr:pantoate--beta-alanine ligase [Duncaniella sp.]
KREPDGLAMSSRNVRLTPAQRALAPVIALTLKASLEKARELNVAQVKAWVTETIDRFPFMSVEYYEIVDPLTMQPVDGSASCSGTVGCITVYCGDVRLIDNIKYPLA